MKRKRVRDLLGASSVFDDRIVTVMPDGIPIGWDVCGGCDRYFTRCTCDRYELPAVIQTLRRETYLRRQVDNEVA